MLLGRIELKPETQHIVLIDVDGSEVSMPVSDALELLTWLEQHRAELEAMNALPPTWAQALKVSEYNTEMDKRNRIAAESRDKPYLPLYDGE